MIAQKQSQCNRILEHMIVHGSITPLEALEQIGCFRLGARINDLRKAGYTIRTDWEEKYGKRYAKYVLVGVPNG